MYGFDIKHAAFAAAACIALSACHSSNSSPAPQFANISGDYTGTMQDSVGGTGTATATFAQQGGEAGGSIKDAESGGTVTAQVTLTITPSNALSGAMVVDYANGTTCTFQTTGTYSSAGSSPAITGSYTAVTNCTGETGTYTLTQQCTDTVTAAERRRMAFPPAC